MIPGGRALRVAAALLALAAIGCAGAGTPAPGAPRAAAPAAVEVTLLHINDVYEITPVEGGRAGGLARLATLRQRLRAENPDTVTLLAGDLFSPSALGTARVDGERLAGRQMVDVLNVLGLDWATFGNHEFDVGQQAFLDRLGESRFRWVSGNVTAADGAALPGVVPSAVLTFGGPTGRPLRLGLVAATLPTGAPDWVRVADPLPSIAAEARRLRADVDVLVALTHLDLDQDMELAATVPEIDLVLGGHEHENWQVRRGSDFTPVAKADANARSAWVHRLRLTPATGALEVASELVPVTPDLPEDPAVAAAVGRWVETAYAAFRRDGFEPEAAVATLPEPLDGRESAVRNRSTALTELVAAALRRVTPAAAVAVFNAGSIRIDDVLLPGPLTQYDVIRVLPFGGQVVEVRMKGSLLARVLAAGEANRGTGGYLHTAGSAGPWEPEAVYPVAIADFLLTGRETGLDFLTRDAPGLEVVGDRGDVRHAVIAEIQARWGGAGPPSGAGTP